MVENPLFTTTNSDKYIGSTERYDIVHDIFTHADYQLTISSLKPNPLAEPQYASFNGGSSQSETRSGISQQESPFKVTLNKKSFMALNEISEKSSSEFIETDYSWIYGKKVDVGLKRSTDIQRAPSISGNNDEEFEMYVPEEIHITSPQIQTEEELYPLCYYRNLTLKWNADPQNELGVLIVVEWFGTMLIGFDYQDIFVRRVDYAEIDNGEILLDDEIFEGIPDSALCHLTILRGAVKNIMVDDETAFKVLAETHASLPFVLVRNIKRKV